MGDTAKRDARRYHSPRRAVQAAQTRRAVLAAARDLFVGQGYAATTVAEKAARSHMNLTFLLPSEELTDKFVKEASKAGMVALKGYRTVGGIRASIYNAMPVEGCQALANFMKDFASKKS